MLVNCGVRVRVVRYDQLKPSILTQSMPSHIIISPGPGSPRERPKCAEVVRKFAGKIPIFGICLGHQLIGELFGGQVVRAVKPMHGKPSRIKHSGGKLFQGLPSEFTVGRYHSLILDPRHLPECLKVTARSVDAIMAFEHRTIPSLFGVQFHPESFLSENGLQVFRNFLRIQPSH